MARLGRIPNVIVLHAFVQRRTRCNAPRAAVQQHAAPPILPGCAWTGEEAQPRGIPGEVSRRVKSVPSARGRALRAFPNRSPTLTRAGVQGRAPSRRARHSFSLRYNDKFYSDLWKPPIADYTQLGAPPSRSLQSTVGVSPTMHQPLPRASRLRLRFDKPSAL